MWHFFFWDCVTINCDIYCSTLDESSTRQDPKDCKRVLIDIYLDPRGLRGKLLPRQLNTQRGNLLSPSLDSYHNFWISGAVTWPWMYKLSLVTKNRSNWSEIWNFGFWVNFKPSGFNRYYNFKISYWLKDSEPECRLPFKEEYSPNCSLNVRQSFRIIYVFIFYVRSLVCYGIDVHE